MFRSERIVQAEPWYGWATLAAIVLGPIIAVLVTRWLDRSRETRRRRLDVFRNLMQTRGVRLDPVHVAALNILEIEFYYDGKVRKAFQEYIRHLSAPMPERAEEKRFLEQRSDLFMNLLFEVGSSVNLAFDKRDLERLSYVPQAWDSEQSMQRRNVEMLGQLLSGQRAMPITHFTGAQSPYPKPPT